MLICLSQKHEFRCIYDFDFLDFFDFFLDFFIGVGEECLEESLLVNERDLERLGPVVL